ncbi:flagellar protein FlgN [Fusibacter bizertensis]
MSKSVEQLVQTLDKETEIYNDLLQLAKSKREVIKAQDIDKLEEMVSEEQGLVVSLFKLEEIREKVVDKIMRDEKIDFVDNVTQLAELLKLDDRHKILDAKNKLMVLIKTVNEETKFNGRLLEDKLELINFNISLLAQTGEDSGRYGKRAGNEENERKNLFDARV